MTYLMLSNIFIAQVVNVLTMSVVLFVVPGQVSAAGVADAEWYFSAWDNPEAHQLLLEDQVRCCCCCCCC